MPGVLCLGLGRGESLPPSTSARLLRLPAFPTQQFLGETIL